ncbi:MAG: thymidylate kinase [Candidatus Sungbacteria bacterium]|nr:thymidylate kinase [Candidatus Sungbacteria bacterium]
MKNEKGKLIVIEGTDGSGKKTQVHLLIERLRKEGHIVATASFPQYGKKSAGLIEEYLNGNYGASDEVSPYVASLFYAVDRFDAARDIKKFLENGAVVVLDRYVDSNAGHQGGKIKDLGEREKFIHWLYNIEFSVFKVPKPEMTFILHVPSEIGYELIFKKQQRLYIEGGKTHDAHEADKEHLKNAEAAYLWLAKQYPNDHEVIECVRAGNLLTPEEIHEMVWERVRSLLS